ncbi:MAG TPA: hypothetical protein VMD28_09310 [Acidimicrobiales bacterium]|nr:hypothetical protein [Acidimicrobiales bacterium]
MESGSVGGVDKETGESSSSAGFERALEGLRETGASTTMRDLVELLARHGSEEGRLLDEYDRLSDTTSDPAARYLIQVIMQDERRHHQMLVEMATAMAWGTLGGVETSVPPLGWEMDEELLAASRRLREQEDLDRHELQTLRKRLRPFEETTMWALIVDLMILDTQKHAAILRFLERHSRGH